MILPAAAMDQRAAALFLLLLNILLLVVPGTPSDEEASSDDAAAGSEDDAKTDENDKPRTSTDRKRCFDPIVPPSSNSHLLATQEDASRTPISRVAFSSCITPEEQRSPNMWTHLREMFKPELFVWLGDNGYCDGNDMNHKRMKYNQVRDDRFYSKYGLVANPKIPTTGIWDDHDYGKDSAGGDYPCKVQSQLEFCVHLNIPETDVRHPRNANAQRGIYSSLMYPLPERYGQNRNGIHLINLDARYFRHRVKFRKKKPEKCSVNGGGGSRTDILGEAQWEWLENELLRRESEIKLIATGIQVLPPTNLRVGGKYYCAYDGERDVNDTTVLTDSEVRKSTFLSAMVEMGEGPDWTSGLDYPKEIWGDVPRARARLLRLAQRSLNEGKAKVVVFLSGNMHYGDVLAKKMPPSPDGVGGGGGPSRTLYEVTASGVGKKRAVNWPCANRVRLRSADDKGDGKYFRECKFPFVANNGKLHNDCTTDSGGDDVNRDGRPWCVHRSSADENGVENKEDASSWGYCLPEEEEVVPRKDQTVTRTTCGENYHQTCGMKDIYGGITVDWDKGVVHMGVHTPLQDVKDGLASGIDVSFVPSWKGTSSLTAVATIATAEAMPGQGYMQRILYVAAFGFVGLLYVAPKIARRRRHGKDV